MKFNNETLRAAVKEWRFDESKAEKKYGHISDWDTSEVTDMANMFDGASSFNQPLEKWDVSQVTNMECMFYGASSFNQPLEKWDVSQVTDMSYMFYHASSFNQPLERWDVSQVTDMKRMFYHTTSFNQPLEKWDVSQVTDMSYMFYRAESFNQPLEKWDVSQVTNMDGRFLGATSFTHQVPKKKLNTPNNLGEVSLTQQGPLSKKLEHYSSIIFSESVKELLEVYHSNRDVEWYFAYKHDLKNSCFQCEKLDDKSSAVKISSFLEYQERTGISEQDERFFDETNAAYIANSMTLWLIRIKRSDFLNSFFERLEDFYQSEDVDFLSALLEENGYEIYNALGEYEMIEFFDCTQDDFEVIYEGVDADEEGNIIKTKFESSLFEEELDDESFAIGFKYLD